MSQADSTVQKASEILTECNFSKLHTKTTDTPFFMPTYDSTTSADVINKPTKDNTVIIDIAIRVHLPEVMYNMYLLLDSNDREFTYNTFTFFSIKQIAERVQVFEKNNVIGLCDLACSYYGMGHIIVLSWNSCSGAFMLRRDGGSNDYDRLDNWNFTLSYNLSRQTQDTRIDADNLFSVLSSPTSDELRELFVNK